YGPSHRALTGFQAAVAERGLTGVDVCCGDDTASGEACVEQLLVTHPEVTAVATINEAALPGMQRALTGAGLSVPADFSVTGVAAQHWAEDFRPPLTAADVPMRDMGAEAVALLLEIIAAPESVPRHRLYSPPISLRSSTGPVRTH
ncbi:substrate-binding domain-containing protein, partial [Streptomyces albogriseolus]|uniref:substrate-binding domain-containing protein n=1 Tax=Streptomyces albogriseolus TaxID=1887 RepID=UPI00346141A1